MKELNNTNKRLPRCLEILISFLLVAFFSCAVHGQSLVNTENCIRFSAKQVDVTESHRDRVTTLFRGGITFKNVSVDTENGRELIISPQKIYWPQSNKSQSSDDDNEERKCVDVQSQDLSESPEKIIDGYKWEYKLQLFMGEVTKEQVEDISDSRNIPVSGDASNLHYKVPILCWDKPSSTEPCVQTLTFVNQVSIYKDGQQLVLKANYVSVFSIPDKLNGNESSSTGELPGSIPTPNLKESRVEKDNSKHNKLELEFENEDKVKFSELVQIELLSATYGGINVLDNLELWGRTLTLNWGKDLRPQKENTDLTLELQYSYEGIGNSQTKAEDHITIEANAPPVFEEKPLELISSDNSDYFEFEASDSNDDDLSFRIEESGKEEVVKDIHMDDTGRAIIWVTELRKNLQKDRDISLTIIASDEVSETELNTTLKIPAPQQPKSTPYKQNIVDSLVLNGAPLPDEASQYKYWLAQFMTSFKDDDALRINEKFIKASELSFKELTDTDNWRFQFGLVTNNYTGYDDAGNKLINEQSLIRKIDWQEMASQEKKVTIEIKKGFNRSRDLWLMGAFGQDVHETHPFALPQKLYSQAPKGTGKNAVTNDFLASGLVLSLKHNKIESNVTVGQGLGESYQVPNTNDETFSVSFPLKDYFHDFVIPAVEPGRSSSLRLNFQDKTQVQCELRYLSSDDSITGYKRSTYNCTELLTEKYDNVEAIEIKLRGSEEITYILNEPLPDRSVQFYCESAQSITENRPPQECSITIAYPAGLIWDPEQNNYHEFGFAGQNAFQWLRKTSDGSPADVTEDLLTQKHDLYDHLNAIVKPGAVSGDGQLGGELKALKNRLEEYCQDSKHPERNCSQAVYELRLDYHPLPLDEKSTSKPLVAFCFDEGCQGKEVMEFPEGAIQKIINLAESTFPVWIQVRSKKPPQLPYEVFYNYSSEVNEQHVLMKIKEELNPDKETFVSDILKLPPEKVEQLSKEQTAQLLIPLIQDWFNNACKNILPSEDKLSQGAKLVINVDELKDNVLLPESCLKNDPETTAETETYLQFIKDNGYAILAVLCVLLAVLLLIPIPKALKQRRINKQRFEQVCNDLEAFAGETTVKYRLEIMEKTVKDLKTDIDRQK